MYIYYNNIVLDKIYNLHFYWQVLLMDMPAGPVWKTEGGGIQSHGRKSPGAVE